jgi:anthranilate synthase component 2
MKQVLLVDNFDSFTYNLLHQIEIAGVQCMVLRNNDPRLLAGDWQADAVVLSPGPCTPPEAGQLMAFIDKFHQKLPMLGVCLGHQALGMHFGARLTRAPRPMHGKTSVLQTLPDAWIQSAGPSPEVMRYHSLVLEDLPATLRPLACSEDGCLMAFRHQSLPLYGLQFHPESVGSRTGQQLVTTYLQQIG